MMMVMVVVRPLGLARGLLLERAWIDAVFLEDLVHGVLNDRIEVRAVARLFGRLDGRGDGRGKLVFQAVRAAARRRRRRGRGGRGRRAGGTGGLGGAATACSRLAFQQSHELPRIGIQTTNTTDTGHNKYSFN